MGEIRQSLILQGTKGNIRVNALLDTGAETSILRYSIAEKIEITRRPSVSIIASNGEPEKGYWLPLFVKISNRLSKVNVVVIKKTTDDLILGQDYLQLNDVILNFKEDKFYLGSHQPKVRKVYRF